MIQPIPDRFDENAKKQPSMDSTYSIILLESSVGYKSRRKLLSTTSTITTLQLRTSLNSYSTTNMTSWGPDRLDLFVVGTDSAVYHKYWQGAGQGEALGWGKDWFNLGGTSIFDPAAVARVSNRLDIFIIGKDSALYHKSWNGVTWLPSDTEWDNLGGVWMEKPTVVSWDPNRIDVFVVGSNRHIYQKFWNGTTWNDGFVDLGGRFLSAPAAVSWAPDRIDLFGTGTDSAVHHKWWDGQQWSSASATDSWENMGGTVYGPPKAVCWGPNRIDLFVSGMTSGLFHKWWDGTQWSPNGLPGNWEALEGVIQRSPEIVSWGPNRLDVFVLAAAINGVAHKFYDGATGWGPGVTSYTTLGGEVAIKNITAVCWSSERLDLFVIGTDSHCYHKAWSPSIGGWQPNGLTGAWEDLGGRWISAVASPN